jgi:ribosomal protein S18 acetylase RimI-like enzyme
LTLDTNQVSIRPMQIDDLNKIAAIHREGFPNSRSTQLGNLFLIKMYRWFLLNHPALAWVAVADNQPIGFVTGAYGGYNQSLFRYALPEIFRGFASHPRMFLRRKMFKLWRNYLINLLPGYSKKYHPKQGKKGSNHTGIASIAVSGGMRGKQVGEALVKAFENGAQQQGVVSLLLSVESDNLSARRLYEKCGWEVTDVDPAYNSTTYTKIIRSV